MKDSAEVTKEVVVMVVMEDVTEEEEVVDKVTTMAAELVFSVDAQNLFSSSSILQPFQHHKIRKQGGVAKEIFQRGLASPSAC